MTAYSDSITEATGRTHPLDLEQIDDVMRIEAGGCLDHLPAPSFTQLARDAWAVVQELRRRDIYPEPQD